ncbi:MAG: ABC transporter ATP-binding protein [Erysipelothrix sp.]|nr:ABC transporter ATP-binding protein [Erysipelothrix sp.]
MFSKSKLGDTKGLIVVVVLILVAQGLGALMTVMIGSIMDFAMASKLDDMNALALNWILLATGSLVVALLNAFTQSKWLARSMTTLKNKYINDLLQLDIVGVQKEKTASMYSVLTNDFDRYEAKYTKNILNLVNMVAQFLFSMALLSVVSPFLMVIPLLMLGFFWNQSKRSSKPIKTEEKKKSESLSVYTNFVNETSLGYEVIKQHQLEQPREEMFRKLAQKVQRDNYSVDVQSTKVDAINSFILVLILFGSLISGMLYAKQSSVSFGNILIVFSALGQVTWPIQRLSLTLAEMHGIDDVLESIQQSVSVENQVRLIRIDSFKSLLFNNNALGYEDQIILSDVDLVLNRNEKVLIVGPSGAGKSTILKTLRQSINPVQGVVSLNGENILEIDVHDYYSLFATIDQIGFIFNGTLQDNVTLFQPVEKENIVCVMKQVGLESLKLDEKILNDGSNLSGGQRARVLLARALILNAEVIVCDEVLASLDASVARSIEQDLLNLPTTVLNVSHIYFEENLSQYDRIYVVENQTVREAYSLDEIKERLIERN